MLNKVSQKTQKMNIIKLNFVITFVNYIGIFNITTIILVRANEATHANLQM